MRLFACIRLRSHSGVCSTSVNSTNACVELGDADVDATTRPNEKGTPRLIGVNQLVWDPPTHVLAAESDEQLRQHTRYAFVVTRGVRDSSSAPVSASAGQARASYARLFAILEKRTLPTRKKQLNESDLTVEMGLLLGVEP
jgi:hypothetical protein